MKYKHRSSRRRHRKRGGEKTKTKKINTKSIFYKHRKKLNELLLDDLSKQDEVAAKLEHLDKVEQEHTNKLNQLMQAKDTMSADEFKRMRKKISHYAYNNLNQDKRDKWYKTNIPTKKRPLVAANAATAATATAAAATVIDDLDNLDLSFFDDNDAYTTATHT